MSNRALSFFNLFADGTNVCGARGGEFEGSGSV